MDIVEMEERELTEARRETIAQVEACWSQMGQGAHLEDWLKIGQTLLIGRQFAMRVAFVNRPEGRGYNQTFGRWMERHGFVSMKKADASDALWLVDDPDRLATLRELQATMTPAERARLNSRRTVRRHVIDRLQAREGRAAPARPAPVTVLKQRLNDTLAELDEVRDRLAAHEANLERFNFEADSAKNIARVLAEWRSAKARAIAQEVLRLLKPRAAPKAQLSKHSAV